MSQAGKSIKDISTATKAVSGISTAISIDGVINTDAIKQYRTALAGLSAEQQALVLSSAGLNAEQANMILTATDAGLAETALSEAEAKRVLAEAGLVSSTATLTAQEITSLATKTGLTEVELQNALAEAGAITTKEGDVIVTEELNAVELKQALISRGVEEANAAETASFIAETTAKKAASTATVTYAGTSNLLVGALSKLKAVIATHPILTFAAILGAGVSAIYKYKKSIDDLIESAKNITDEYESTSSKLHKDASTMESLSEQYVKLSKGVNSLGENVNLTTDEYEQYKTIVNQIAELSPNLIKGYSDEGDAILKVKDNVKELTDAYNDNIIAANNSAKAQSKTIIDAAHKERVKYNAKDTGEYQVQGLEDYLNGNIETWELLSRFNNPYAGGLGGYQYKDLTKLLDELGIDPGFSKDDEFYTSTKESEEFTAKLKTTLENLSTDQRDMLQGYVDRRNSEFEDIFKGERDVLKAHIENSLLTDKDLEKLPDSIKTTLLNLSDSLDVDVFKTFGTPEEMFKYANQITNTFKNLTDEQKETFEIGVNLETLWNNNELSYDEYKAKVEAFYNLLRTLFPDNENIITTFQVMFDMPDEKDFEEQENLFQNRIKKVKSKNNSDQLLSSTPTGRDVLGSNFTSNDREFQQWADRQSQSVREQLYNISDKDLEVGLSFKTDLERDAWLADLLETGKTTVEVELEPNASDLVSDLKDVEDAFSNLGTVKDAGTSASASDIEQVNSDMGGVTFGKYGDDVAYEDINAMSSALEKYNKVLTDNASTTEDVNEATNDLVTAYIDLSGKLDNVTEATKDKAIEELESYGVENAEEVVVTRLNKVYKNFSKNLQSLSKKVADYHDTLEEGVDADGFTEAAQDIAKTVKEMFTTTNTNGKDIIPNIDDSFITKNLEDIKLAAEGDIDAITRLRVEAAKTIDMDVNINDDQLYSEWNAIASAISALDGTQFEIGGYMDDSEIISALNNILATGKYTVEEFQAMVSQISGGTLSAEVSYETKEITLPTPQFNSTKAYQTIASDGKITSANSWKVLDTKTTVSLPKMQYKYNGGTGAGAKYSGGGGSGSGGSGGGGDSSGSDNTKTEDSEETFDWIETHLTRLDEQMDRLDEKVQDVYTSWADRNKNVRKEMKLLEDQIDANTSAAQSYLNYANSIKVNNGETKVNDDDYGDNDSEQKTYDQSQLTAAINEWKSGKYQKLIKQGKLGDDAIEKIKNQYLVDTINEYKTWYEKSIAASDTANSLKITLKEKYKDLFDNIVSQYDDLCTTIEKRTSILDERISRMEEHGYFVSKTYYESQKELEQENYKNLKTERDKLIKQLNEAVETGGIKKGSEAWNDMYQQILDVNKEMETSQNNLVRLDNQQRQNDWDRFDWLQERLHRINEEADHFRSMFDIYKKVDDKGNLTNEGWGNIAMDITKLKNDEEAIKRYNKELAETQALLNKKPGDQNLIQRVEDLQSKLWEYSEDIASIKDSIKNDMNEAFQAHLSFLSETINKYKEALSDAKDLYDYQKNIQNQTANIVKLEKQLAAYQNDDSEAARKKRVELQKQLDDAKQGLEETQWDRYISETGEMLDDMYSDYEEFLNDKLDDIDQLVEDVIKGVTESGGSVTDAINAIVKKFGVETFNLDEMLTNSDKTVTDKINDVITAVQKVAGDVVDELKILQRASQSDAKSSDIKVNDDGTVGTQTTREQQEATKAGVASKSVSDRVQKEEEAKKAKNKTWEKGKFLVWNSETNQLDTKYTGGTWHTTNDGKRYYTYKKNGKTVRLGEGVKGGVTHIIDGVKVHFNSKGYVEWESFEQELKEPKMSTVSKEELEKNIKLTSLSTGSKNITKKGVYETNEATTGSELIYKTSYGGILTPLDAGDMVFTHEMSQRLWDIAANKIPVDGDIQMVNLPSNINTGTYNTNADISITLPNVTNYDEFKKGLQNDDKFEKFIKEITIGQLNGNNTMNKRKY